VLTRFNRLYKLTNRHFLEEHLVLQIRDKQVRKLFMVSVCSSPESTWHRSYHKITPIKTQPYKLFLCLYFFQLIFGRSRQPLTRILLRTQQTATHFNLASEGGREMPESSPEGPHDYKPGTVMTQVRITVTHPHWVGQSAINTTTKDFPGRGRYHADRGTA